MKKLNKEMLCLFMSVCIIAGLSGCGKKQDQAAENNQAQSSSKLSVVATIFPEYDFLRQIGGDYINLKMLVTPGAETHSFEPTPQDIKAVNESDLFVYVGGDSDGWVESILDSVDTDRVKVVTLMDCVQLVPEETVAGMTPEEETSETDSEEEETEYDEHVWTSPKNARLIVQKLCDNLCQLDPAHKTDYQKNTKAYQKKLDKLDQEFQEVAEHGKRKEIIVGDRFPFRYFADAYGLTYYAAFPGCAADTEPNAGTIAFLTEKVKKDQIPVVFHIELSNEKVCNSICEATGAKSELLNAVHNVSKKDFEAGVTYMDLMEHNVKVLKEALN